MSHAGTYLHEMTVRIPQAVTSEEAELGYREQATRRGLEVVGDVIVDIQPEFFSETVEVTYKARLAPEGYQK